MIMGKRRLLIGYGLILLVSIMIVGYAINAYRRAYYEYQNSPFGYPFRYHYFTDIYFLNSSVGYLLDSFIPSHSEAPQHIFITHNAGATWQKYAIDVDTFYPITQVQFISVNIGWFHVGGEIYKSTNGGLNWALQTQNISSYITGFYILNETLGWATTNVGTVLFTKNGGQDWNIQLNISDSKIKDGPVPPLPVYNTFYGIYFLNMSCGWVLYQWGIGVPTIHLIFCTIDGGSTWTNYSIPTGGKMLFIDQWRGFIIDNTGALFLTNDSGRFWQNQSISPYPLRDIYFYNKSLGWISGYRTIFQTINGGINWNLIQNISISEYFNRIVFLNETMGWIISDSDLYNSLDGGVTLSSVQIEEINPFYFNAAWVWVPLILIGSIVSGGTWGIFNSDKIKRTRAAQSLQRVVDKVETTLFNMRTITKKILSCFILVALFYGSSLIFIFIHELGHAFMGLLAGGFTNYIEVNFNLSGLTWINVSSTHSWDILIYFAGFLIELILGIILVMIFFTSKKNKRLYIVLAVIITYPFLILELISFAFYSFSGIYCDAYLISVIADISPFTMFLIFFPFLVLSILLIGKILYNFYKHHLSPQNTFLGIFLLSFLLFLGLSYLIYYIQLDFLTIVIS